MLVVTHEMGFARKAADRVVFMADGEIVEKRHPSEFFTDPQSERARIPVQDPHPLIPSPNFDASPTQPCRPPAAPPQERHIAIRSTPRAAIAAAGLRPCRPVDPRRQR